jgi:hypothetical protein
METTELISPRNTLMPKFFYCCREDTHQLHRANLLTGEQSSNKIPSYEFKHNCRWSELPGGSLIITGGNQGYRATAREVVKIDTLRECAVSTQPPMHTARCDHAALYHSQYLYVLAGYDLRECERYVCAESRWEELPAMPVACYAMSAVELDNSLYAFGGRAETDLDTIQKLSLDSLTWQLMQLKLPQTASYFPCFKTEPQVYLLINETLYTFTPIHIKAVKTVPEDIWSVTSYYSRGVLYYSGDGIGSLDVGEFT